MSIPWALLAILTFTIGTADSAGYYTIVGPQVIRPNTQYDLSVSVQGVPAPTTVVVDILGRQDSGGDFRKTEYVSVEPYSTKIVSLQVPDIGPGTYNLTVEGRGGLDFFNTTLLTYKQKSFSVFIQTDKAIYKPGHKVMFRIIVLNSHLKPVISDTLRIHITDGEKNRVKQWPREIPNKGVFSSELQLSENPVMGDWEIVVNLMGQEYKKSFQVAEYVLPKFDVTIDVPQHATMKDSKVVATVRSKYTYGRPVKGELTITAYPSFVFDVIQPTYPNPIRKVIPIDGKATTEFDLLKDLKLTDDYERQIQIDAVVEEALTGRRQNTTAFTILHKHKYKLEIVRPAENFKPGLKYTAFIKLAHHDGTPVTDKTNPIKVRSSYSYNNDDYDEFKHKLSDNGIIELNFFPPRQNATALTIEAEYLDVKEWFSTVIAAQSPSNNFIQAYVITSIPKVNEDVEMEVNCTEPIKYISYQILARGTVVTASTVTGNGGNSLRWRFLATFAMAPTAHLVVQYIREDGEVVADAIDIEFDGALQNFVDVELNPSQAEPGSNVDIKLEAKPNSFIGLLGVDQSVLLLKTGNDITEDDVLDELSSYDANESGVMYRTMMRVMKMKSKSFWWPGLATASEVFQRAGAVIMSNGFVYENTPWLYYRGNFPENAGAFDLAYAANVYEEKMSGAGSSAKEPLRVRSNFPETWLWQTVETGFDGKSSLKKTVPDTITSWVISAFSVDPLYGLGLLTVPQKLKVFRPFFISLDLPYSIIRGETISIPVVVFNYMDREVSAEVIMENDGTFDFADISNEVDDGPPLAWNFRKKKLTIAPNSGSTTSFMIAPKEVGYIPIKITAKSALAGDAVERKLLVKPEGETVYMNKAFFVDLRSSNTYENNITLDIPKNFVAGSEFIEVSATGDILGPSIVNLDNLIKMPFGCGEQNMLNFVPNIVVLNYLKSTDQLTKSIETKSIHFMEKGYQQELTYKHKDGSFSAFGMADKNGSTWLTAFVAKSFSEAEPYIAIENDVILSALQWLASVQTFQGDFPEVGQVSHTDMQGGSGRGLALTSFTLTAFLSNREHHATFRNTINKAIDYIDRNIQGINDTFALAISTYALHLAKHPSKEIAFNLLEMKSKSKGNAKWWERNERASDKNNPHVSLPNSVNVEMTAYGLLTYLERGLIEDSIPIMRWLVSQQNAEGGFASTQDTVIGLKALAQLGRAIVTRNVNINTSFSYKKGVSSNININPSNSMILQKQELPKKTRQVEISAKGNGFAIVYVSYRFNVNVTGAWPLFTLDPQVDKNSDTNHLQLSVCSSFTGGNSSNMAVMEVSLPSGYTLDSDALPSLHLQKKIKRVETKDGDTVLVLYFDKMEREEYCPTVSAFRTHKVAKQRPVPVVVYDYYDQTRKARAFYEPRRVTECDICEEENCRVCSPKRGFRGGDGGKGSSPLTSSPSYYITVIALALSFFTFAN